MKKPEEIKHGLEIVVNGCLTCDCCITDCPYDPECHPMNEDTTVDMPKKMAADAIDYIQQLENHIRELTEKVAQLEAAQPRWISVDDILPDKGSEVLLCDKGGVIGVGYYTGTWYSCNTPYRITHWMPLPEAPKEDIKNE